MTKRIAPTKLTGGGGFKFEDQIAAYFFSCLLTDRPPYNPELGTIYQIEFQTRSLGWHLDDILLSLSFRNETRLCAISVKSNSQFTSNQAPPEFVLSAWEQFLHEETTSFNKSNDLLALIISPPTAKLMNEIEELLNKSRSQDPESFMKRMEKPGANSEIQRKLFNSFTCPDDLAKKYNVGRERIGNLLASVRVFPFDFNSAISTKLQSALENCRTALTTEDLNEASKLWNQLLVLASEYRPIGGTVNLTTLLDKLRNVFHLKCNPRYKSDWERLLAFSKQERINIPDKIGGKVFIERTETIQKLENNFEKSRVQILLGSAGSGKTVIAKSWADKLDRINNSGSKTASDQSNIFWLDAASLNTIDYRSFERDLGLSNPLEEVLAFQPAAKAYMIVDGLDRIGGEVVYRNFAQLVHHLKLDDPSSPWHLLLSSPPEDWERLKTQLSRFSIVKTEIIIYQIPNLLPEEFNSIWQEFPNLEKLKFQRHLRDLLLKPKVLDLLAHHSTDTENWTGESDLIDWFWESEIKGKPPGSARSRFLMLLAELQADELQQSTSITAFSTADLSEMDTLIRDRLCQSKNEQLSFYHELYGDWARQRLLRSKDKNLFQLRQYMTERLESPLWHRAIRLYGLYLLEKKSDLREWQALFYGSISPHQFNNFTPNVMQDLLLDAVIFAAEPQMLLEQRLWPELQKEEGLLLKRLLTRFLHVATIPNPLVIEKLTKLYPELEVKAATLYRVPYWPYWLPMLEFLQQHNSEVTKLAPLEVSEISGKWLTWSEANWKGRKEAAELAVNIAENILIERRKVSTGFQQKAYAKEAFRAVLQAFPVLSEQVSILLLEACARKIEASPSADTDLNTRGNSSSRNLYRGLTKNSSHFSQMPYRKLPQPWPDGPLKRVDRDFKEICLHTDALQPIIDSSPALAREIILALVICEPRYPDPEEIMGSLSDNLGIDRIERGWFPPFYDLGPWLYFLQSRPTEGLELILRLVNFVTERWASQWDDHGQVVPGIALELPTGSVFWAGDNRLYYWYIASSLCPQPVAIALMALEKWLYEQIDAGKPIEPVIEKILLQSRSVVFGGLLSGVGCKQPELFRGLLKPFLGIPEFYWWEELNSQTGDFSYNTLGWSNQPKNRIEEAIIWFNLPHRKLSLNYLGRQSLLYDEETKDWFEKFVRPKWKKLLGTNSFETVNGVTIDYLKRLLDVYDPKNYRIIEDPQNGTVFEFVPPEETIIKNAQAQIEFNKNIQPFIFILQCNQLLKAGQPLPSEQAEQYWNYVDYLTQTDILADMKTEEIFHIEDAICAGIAILVHFFGDWLEHKPERKAWCNEQLIKIISNPPPHNRGDFAVSQNFMSWDSFCARTIPILWSKDATDRNLKKCIGLLTTNHHHLTVTLLFSQLSVHRDILGHDFKAAQHLLIRWATILREYARHERWSYPEGNHEAPFNLAERREEEIASFVSGNIGPDIPSWSELINQIALHEPKEAEIQKNKLEFVRPIPKNIPGPSLGRIYAGFAWLPNLEEAHSDTERNEWLTFFKEALVYTIKLLQFEVNDQENFRDDFDLIPNDWGRWLTFRIADLVVHLEPKEKPGYFWKTIFELSSYSYWVEEFLENWFEVGLSELNKNYVTSFIREWQAMIEYALVSNKWNGGDTGYYSNPQIWEYLSGFNRSGFLAWDKAENGIIVSQMYDSYKLLADKVLRTRRLAPSFIKFLTKPATQSLLIDGMKWIEIVGDELGDKYWNDSVIQAALEGLVNYCWRNEYEKIRYHHEVFGIFKKLLGKLANRQNQVALVIQEQLINMK